jgi:hypothetical protein
MKLVAALIATIACGDDGTKTPEATPTDDSAPAAATVAVPAPPPAPMPSTIETARCGEPCLVLVDTPLGKLAETYATECGGMVTKDPGFEDCKHLEFTRNCIYAAHGFVFADKKWKRFEKQPWYRANPAFKPASLSALERANVHELDQRAKACKKGVHISGADHERVKAWFGALPKPELPKVLLSGEHPVTDAQLLQIVNGDRKNLRLPTKAVASYDSALPVAVAKALGVTDKLRSILVDISGGIVGDEDNPVAEGTYVRLVYDTTDKLRAVTAHHYVYD